MEYGTFRYDTVEVENGLNYFVSGHDELSIDVHNNLDHSGW